MLPWLGGDLHPRDDRRARVFYFTKGASASSTGEESGRKILRFNAFERFTHWLTGHVLHRARDLRAELHLRQAPADADHRARTPSRPGRNRQYAHNFVPGPFMLGRPVHALRVDPRIFPIGTDWVWLKAGGGFWIRRHCAGTRFNGARIAIF
jgi:formate dehydrogenase subunit gamma